MMSMKPTALAAAAGSAAVQDKDLGLVAKERSSDGIRTIDTYLDPMFTPETEPRVMSGAITDLPPMVAFPCSEHNDPPHTFASSAGVADSFPDSNAIRRRNEAFLLRESDHIFSGTPSPPFGTRPLFEIFLEELEKQECAAAADDDDYFDTLTQKSHIEEIYVKNDSNDDMSVVSDMTDRSCGYHDDTFVCVHGIVKTFPEETLRKILENHNLPQQEIENKQLLIAMLLEHHRTGWAEKHIATMDLRNLCRVRKELGLDIRKLSKKEQYAIIAATLVERFFCPN